TTDADKFVILRVGYLVHVDGERGDVYLMSIKFVIPSKGHRGLGHAKSCDSGGNILLPRPDRVALTVDRKNLRLLALERQPMQHVRKGLGVHKPMLDCDPKELVMRRVVQAAIHRLAHVAVVLQYLSFTRPVAGFIIRKVSGSGINAKCKQPIEFFLTGIHCEWTGTYEIPVKSFEMPEVENDAVSLGNRTIVKSFGSNQL